MKLWVGFGVLGLAKIVQNPVSSQCWLVFLTTQGFKPYTKLICFGLVGGDQEFVRWLCLFPVVVKLWVGFGVLGLTKMVQNPVSRQCWWVFLTTQGFKPTTKLICFGLVGGDQGFVGWLCWVHVVFVLWVVFCVIIAKIVLNVVRVLKNSTGFDLNKL